MSSPFLESLNEFEVFGGHRAPGELIDLTLFVGQTETQKRETIRTLEQLGIENPEQKIQSLLNSGISQISLVGAGLVPQTPAHAPTPTPTEAESKLERPESIERINELINLGMTRAQARNTVLREIEAEREASGERQREIESMLQNPTVITRINELINLGRTPAQARNLVLREIENAGGIDDFIQSRTPEEKQEEKQEEQQPIQQPTQQPTFTPTPIQPTEKKKTTQNNTQPVGRPLLRPEFNMGGTEFIDKLFENNPIQDENEEWAEYNFVPPLDRHNLIEVENAINQKIRFMNPMFFPKFEKPQKPPSKSLVFLKRVPMKNEIQINQRFVDKFDGADMGRPIQLTDVYNRSVFDINFLSLKLFNPI